MFKMEVDMLQATISGYRKACGVPPPVENAPLIAALLGNNPGRRQFIYRFSLLLNRKNEAVDPWGNPLRFKKVNGTVEVDTALPPPSFRISARPL
jgi:hypothetical protein